MNYTPKELIIYQKYLRFLKENHILHRVIQILELEHDENIINHKYKYYEVFFLSNTLNKCHITKIFALSRIFCCWASTTEGQNFWLDINAKWVKYCQEEKLF